MNRVAVLNVVGLSESLLGPNMPRVTAWAKRVGLQSFPPAFPAVTCTAQSSMLTGRPVREHGIVANGWYDRENAEVKFWKQSNHIVRGEKIWERLRADLPGFTCAKLFWWYNMYSSADFSITPRPLYPADGRKVFDVHTQPMEMREEIKRDLGPFPFPTFWGPMASIPCSQWIANSARWVEEKHKPTLSLVYLPHLDYGLQKLGPDAPEMLAEFRAIDDVTADLIEFFEARGVKVLIVSEYGISRVSKAIHLNRLFRAKGWLSIKDELGRETLDAGGCKVFAVADHQIAHVYVQDKALLPEVRTMLEATDGVEEVRTAEQLWGDNSAGSDRGGDLVAIAEEDAWFTYYYWNDDAKAPDFARCIDIHRKPGYDPCELYFDPKLTAPKLRVLKHVAKVKLGLRSLMEIIPLDASLVKGSHGRDKVAANERPVLIGSSVTAASAEDIAYAIAQAVQEA